MVKTGLGTIAGALAIGILLSAFGIVYVLTPGAPVPAREHLAASTGTLLGYETKHSRYSSYHYALLQIDGQPARLSLPACAGELQNLPPGTPMDVLHSDGMLYESRQGAVVTSAYEATADALASFRWRNKVAGLGAGAIGAFIFGLLLDALAYRSSLEQARSKAKAHLAFGLARPGRVPDRLTARWHKRPCWIPASTPSDRRRA